MVYGVNKMVTSKQKNVQGIIGNKYASGVAAGPAIVITGHPHPQPTTTNRNV